MRLRFHYIVPAQICCCPECKNPYIIVNKDDPMGKIEIDNYGIESTCSHQVDNKNLNAINSYVNRFLGSRKSGRITDN